MEAEVDTQYRVLSRIVHTAAFLVEREEEAGALNSGDTAPLKFMVPSGMSPQGARSFQHRVIRPAQLSVTPTAIALRRELLAVGLAPEKFPTESEIEHACAPLERAFMPVDLANIELRLDRAVMRGVRYIWQIYTIRAKQHSRVFEIFVPGSLVPRGRSKMLVQGQVTHGEHVVPCCELLLLCRSAFEQIPEPWPALAPQLLARKLTEIVKSLLVIVDVTEKEAGDMDRVNKWNMPEGWSAESDCPFERLHRQNIAFEMLPESLRRFPAARCACQD